MVTHATNANSVLDSVLDSAAMVALATTVFFSLWSHKGRTVRAGSTVTHSATNAASGHPDLPPSRCFNLRIQVGGRRDVPTTNASPLLPTRTCYYQRESPALLHHANSCEQSVKKRPANARERCKINVRRTWQRECLLPLRQHLARCQKTGQKCSVRRHSQKFAS